MIILYLVTAWLLWLIVFWVRNPLFPAKNLAKIPLLPDPRPEDCIAVVIPHPDDETVGMAGIIQRARSKGATVHVALMTDGNKHGKKLIRYQEIAQALALCGVVRENIHFFEYPDGKLRQAPDLVERLSAFLKEQQPTHVFTTDAADTHPDHAILGEAVPQVLQKAGLSIPLYTSLIHYHRFPRPIGQLPGTPLLPPQRRYIQGQTWVNFPLLPEEQSIKKAAIAVYKSQLSTPFLRGLILSFDRTNELFIKQ